MEEGGIIAAPYLEVPVGSTGSICSHVVAPLQIPVGSIASRVAPRGLSATDGPQTECTIHMLDCGLVIL